MSLCMYVYVCVSMSVYVCMYIRVRYKSDHTHVEQCV